MKYRSADRIEPAHIGRRVTIRRRLDEGGSSDVIGILEHMDEASLTVRDRNGERHQIGRGDIVAAKVIGDPPRLHNPSNPAPG